MPAFSQPHPLREQPSPALAYGATLLAVAAAALAAILADREVRIPNLSLVFVLPVVFAAVTFGWRASLAAAVAGALAYNFFLIEPRFTMRVSDPANIWALGLLMLVGAIVSTVAAQSRRRAIAALEAVDQARALNALARTMVGESSRAGLAGRCAEALSELFHAPAVVLLEDDDGLRPMGIAGGAVPTEADLEAARWSLASRLPVRGGAYPAGEATFDVWPVVTRQRQHAVVGVSLAGRDAGRPDQPERLVEIVSGYLSVALDRESYAAQAMQGQVRVAGEQLKADLLAAVSHDLKTPLSTVLFTLQSLRRFDTRYDATQRGELLASAEAEAERLSRMVESLLQMNRLEAGAVVVRLAPVAVADLAAAALTRAAAALAGRNVVNEVQGDAILMVDAALFESALSNVMENAGKYAPAGSTVLVRYGSDGPTGWIEVLDEGPGFAGPAEPLFEKFVRGREGDGRPPGVGLGLSIARGFAKAQGGRLDAADRGDRPGARVRLYAPLWDAA